MEPRSPEELSEELERLAEEQINDLDSESSDRSERGKQRRERVVALYGVPPLWVQEQNVAQLRRREEEI